MAEPWENPMSIADRTFDMSVNVLSPDGAIDVAALGEQTAPPEPFEPGAPFWTDPYIASRLLDAHHDPSHDAASRTAERIGAEVEWLLDALDLASGDRLLDLGCGPGLYAERFHDHGLDVTGVDHSERAIENACERARESGREIDYRVRDYRTLDESDVDLDGLDAAILIYYDFATFGPDDRSDILSGVREALEPNGAFAFDVYGEGYRDLTVRSDSWEIASDGFWRPDPHLILTSEIGYPDRSIGLDQHVIVDEDGTATPYRFWRQLFSRSSIRSELAENGFLLERSVDGFTETEDAHENGTFGVVARTRPDDEGSR